MPLSIEGVSVEFPHVPYPCQVLYMRKVIEALSASKNALLESPTGTGKTVSLLCSSLAWQLEHNAKCRGPKVKAEYHPEALSSLAPHVSTKPTYIIYASRTHAQLQQVVGELKKTSYSPRFVVLGSRDQLCIHESLRSKKFRGPVLDLACSGLCNQHKCRYKNNIEGKKIERFSLPAMMDIEEAVTFGRSSETCSYFTTREAAKTAELVLMPYNYLLDSFLRGTMNLEWSRAIVIFDEAHNLEEAASTAASFSFSSNDLTACLRDLLRVLEVLSGGLTTTSVTSSFVFSAGSTSIPSISDVRYLIQVVERLESRLHGIPLHSDAATNLGSCDMDGVFLLELFLACGVSIDKAKDISGALKVCVDLLISETDSVQTSTVNARVTSTPKLIHLARSVDQLFKTHKAHSYAELKKISADYRVFVKEEPSASNQFRTKRILYYWAFSGGIAMEELKDIGVRSIIMTSGTLSPMNSFKDEMRINFDICIENSHIISDKQLWVGCLGAGFRHQKLNSSFNTRDSRAYKDDVGRSILGICRSILIGDQLNLPISGGILVFFPSYFLLETMLSQWKETGLYDEMVGICKVVLTESRARQTAVHNGAHSSAKFFNSEDDSDNDDEVVHIESLVTDFQKALLKFSKCLLLAVCRGKVSEGIDFKDNHARAVILVGVPFAPCMDPKVRQKQKYLDERLNAPSHFQSRVWSSFQSQKCTGNRLSGREWYNQAAIKAVNQAVGRIIRHKKDWGAVFLLDERYSEGRYSTLMSKWILHRMLKYDKFADAISNSRKFFTECATDPELRVLKQAPTISSVNSIDASLTLKQQYRRQIEVSESEIGGDKGSTFLQPRILSEKRSLLVKRNIVSKLQETAGSDATGLDRSLRPSLSDSTSSFRKKTLSLEINKNTISFRNKDSQASVSRTKAVQISSFQKVPMQFRNSLELPTAPKVEKSSQEIGSIIAEQDIGSQGVYKPSKRAKMMSASVTVGLGGGGTSSLSSRETSSKNAIILAALTKRKHSSHHGRAFEIISSKPSEISSKENYYEGDESVAELFGCIICRESSLRIRGAAKCGHVCCLECWTQWLRKNKTCPLCRLPTNSDDISRIKVNK